MVKDRIFRRIVYSMLAVAYSWGLAASVIHSMRFESSKSAVLVYCMVSLVLFNLICINRYTFVSFAVLSVIVFAYWGFGIFANGLVAVVQVRISRAVTWFYDYVAGYQYLDLTYSEYFAVLMSIVVSTFAFIVIVKHMQFYTAVAGGLIYVLLTINLGYDVYVPGFIAYAFCVLCLFVRDRMQKSGTMFSNMKVGSECVFVLWVMPFVLIVLAITYGMSMSAEHERVEWMQKKVEAFHEWYYEQSWDWFDWFGTATGSDFSLVSTGFQPDRDSIGGDVKLDDRLVMNVRSDHRLYLKGSVRDRYTGSNWVASDIEEFSIKDRLIDQYITDNYFSNRVFLYKLLRYNGFRGREYPEIYEQVFLRGRAEVEHVNLNTNALFYPDNLVYINEWNGSKDYVIMNNNGEFYLPGNVRDNNAYSFEYRVVDRSNPIVERLLKASTRLGERVYDGEGDSVKEKYYEIKQKYTAIGSSVPKRVIELARDITKDYHNPYDKVKAVEEYLSSNYTYTLTPGYTPEGRDFVDYFLFDLKKGYCTYYASAMTIMVRALGIPARYVEGFVLPAQPNTEGVYKVTNDLSHAWVEVFFSGLGWVHFEPTSPFYALLNSQQQDTIPVYTGDMLYEDEYYEEYMNRMMGRQPIDADIPVSVNVQNNTGNMVLQAIIGFFIILILILWVFAIRRLKFTHYLKKLEKLGAEQVIIKYYHRILQLMKLYNWGIKPGETPFEYARRVDDWFISNEDSFYTITEIYVKARYSRIPLTEKEKNRVIAFYHVVIKDLKSYLNLFSFAYWKYVRLKY